MGRKRETDRHEEQRPAVCTCVVVKGHGKGICIHTAADKEERGGVDRCVVFWVLTAGLDR